MNDLASHPKETQRHFREDFCKARDTSPEAVTSIIDAYIVERMKKGGNEADALLEFIGNMSYFDGNFTYEGPVAIKNDHATTAFRLKAEQLGLIPSLK